MLLTHWARRAASRADCTAGSNSATSTPLAAGEEMLGIGSRETSRTPSLSETIASDAGKSRGFSSSAVGILSRSTCSTPARGPGCSRTGLGIAFRLTTSPPLQVISVLKRTGSIVSATATTDPSASRTWKPPECGEPAP